MVADTSWTIDTFETTYTADAMTIDDGWPEFKVGNTTQFSLLFNKGSHTSEYRGMLGFGEYLYDGAVETGTDYRERPYYKEFIHPKFPTSGAVQSFVVKLTPASRINNVEGWWVILTNVTDDTLIEGSWERLTFEAFVLAPATEGDRTYINNQYEVE